MKFAQNNHPTLLLALLVYLAPESMSEMAQVFISWHAKNHLTLHLSSGSIKERGLMVRTSVYVSDVLAWTAALYGIAGAIGTLPH